MGKVKICIMPLRLLRLVAMLQKQFKKAHVLLVEYPGYGIYHNVQGTEKRVKEDSIIVFRFCLEELGFQSNNIILIGRSLGSGPATYLAETQNPFSLILLSPFLSIKDVVRENLTSMMSWMVKKTFNNLDSIKKVHCPVLIIHGKKDKMINYKSSQKLIENCQNKMSELKTPEMMTHTEMQSDVDFFAPLILFNKKIVKKIQEIEQNIKEIKGSIGQSPSFILKLQNLKKFKYPVYNQIF